MVVPIIKGIAYSIIGNASGILYSGCKKTFRLREVFLLQTLMPQSYYSEHIYDKRYSSSSVQCLKNLVRPWHKISQLNLGGVISLADGISHKLDFYSLYG